MTKRKSNTGFDTFDEYFENQMKDPEMRQLWEEGLPELERACALAEARINAHMTQMELSEKTGINQADISKLENGTRKPTLKMLGRIADALGYNMKIVFEPKEK